MCKDGACGQVTQDDDKLDPILQGIRDAKKTIQHIEANGEQIAQHFSLAWKLHPAAKALKKVVADSGGSPAFDLLNELRKAMKKMALDFYKLGVADEHRHSTLKGGVADVEVTMPREVAELLAKLRGDSNVEMEVHGLDGVAEIPDFIPGGGKADVGSEVNMFNAVDGTTHKLDVVGLTSDEIRALIGKKIAEWAANGKLAPQ